METTTAILLRRVKYGDTSLIVTWLTARHGVLKTIAKGARAPKSTFAGRLDLFYEAEISFARSRKSEIHTLREVALCDTREGLRASYVSVQLASYFAQCVDHATMDEHDVPEIFDLLTRALNFLATQPASLRALEHFERELARISGVLAETPDVSPARALQRIFGPLPKLRVELVKALRAAQ
jgi:DNA repair protein RecO (recombination protein O)